MVSSTLESFRRFIEEHEFLKGQKKVLENAEKRCLLAVQFDHSYLRNNKQSNTKARSLKDVFYLLENGHLIGVLDEEIPINLGMEEENETFERVHTLFFLSPKGLLDVFRKVENTFPVVQFKTLSGVSLSTHSLKRIHGKLINGKIELFDFAGKKSSYDLLSEKYQNFYKETEYVDFMGLEVKSNLLVYGLLFNNQLFITCIQHEGLWLWFHFLVFGKNVTWYLLNYTFLDNLLVNYYSYSIEDIKRNDLSFFLGDVFLTIKNYLKKQFPLIYLKLWGDNE